VSRFDLETRLPYEMTANGWMTPAEIAMNEEHMDDTELLRVEGHWPVFSPRHDRSSCRLRDVDPAAPIPSGAVGESPKRERCGACGRFLRKDSFYTNRCSDCWGPEDEFV
jgi:hypothetical protein